MCILVDSYGHVSLIIDQLDWQRCAISFVALLWSGRGITGELASPENRHRAYCHLIDSHRHRSIHGSGAAKQRLIDVIGFNGVAVWPATYQWCASLEWRNFKLFETMKRQRCGLELA